MSEDRKQAALDYHALPRPGKIAIEVTKPCETQEDLALAYTPGVAEPVRAIAEDPANALQIHRQGQSGRRDHGRHGGIRARQCRRAGRQAGDGR